MQHGENVFPEDATTESFWEADFTVQNLTHKMLNMSCNVASTSMEAGVSSDDDVPIITFKNIRRSAQKDKKKQHDDCQNPHKIIYFSGEQMKSLNDPKIKETVFFFSSSDEDTPVVKSTDKGNSSTVEGNPEGSTPHSPPQDVTEGMAELFKEALLSTGNNSAGIIKQGVKKTSVS